MTTHELLLAAKAAAPALAWLGSEEKLSLIHISEPTRRS